MVRQAKFSSRRFFQSNAEFIVTRQWQQYSIVRSEYYSPALQRLIADPDKFMYENRLKYAEHDTTTVALTYLDGIAICIKRYNLKNRLHALKKAFTTSRAVKCWRNAHRLLHHGINTPKPIAMVERRIGPIRRQAYFIYQYQPGDLLEKVMLVNADDTWRHVVARRVYDLLQAMFAAEMVHGDLKHTNIILNRGEPYLLDLDGMHYLPSRRLQKRKHKDIQRFMQNWYEEPRLLPYFASLFSEQSE